MSLAILAGLVVVVLCGLPVLVAALLAAGAMLLTRCATVDAARRSIDWEVLVAIAASFGIAKALELTGATNVIANDLIAAAGGDRWLALTVIYGVTMVATHIITHNAAAALMFPLAMSTADTLHVSPMPFVIAVMIAASAGFATPIGYQTNLMVYGPGGYRFSDYMRIGVPLDLLIWAVSIALTPLFFPF